MLPQRGVTWIGARAASGPDAGDRAAGLPGGNDYGMMKPEIWGGAEIPLQTARNDTAAAKKGTIVSAANESLQGG